MTTSQPRQIPLDLGHQPALTRDDFLPTPENRAALALVDKWPDWKNNIAAIAGPVGSGKTHLAAIFANASSALDASYNFDLAMKAAEDGLPIYLDDADMGRLDERQLFHLINAVRAGNATFLMTGSSFPASWNIALPDLRSRLRAITAVELEAPGDALLDAVLFKLFADRQVEIDAQVVRYITRRMERSLASAITWVEKLDHAALERRRPVTRALAAEIFGRDEDGSLD